MRTLCKNVKEIDYKQYRNFMRSGIDIYDSAALLNSTKTIFSLVQDKINDKQTEFKKGESEFFKRATKAMIKENLADWFGMFKKKDVIIKQYPGIYQHDQYDFIIAKPEYSITVDGIECGSLITIRDYIDYQWENEEQGKIPDNYLYYAQHLMAVMGWEKVYIFIYNSMTLDYREVLKDQFMIDQIIKDECAMWDKYIIKQEIPPVADKDVELINQLMANKKKNVEKDCIEIMSLVTQYHTLSEQINANNYLEKDRKALQGQIKLYLDGATSGKCQGYKINNDKQFRVIKKD